MGIEAEDVADNTPCEIWPDNRVPFGLFRAASTQWRSSGAGPTGLDYNVVKWLMELWRVAPDKQLETLGDIQALEMAALNEMHKK